MTTIRSSAGRPPSTAARRRRARAAVLTVVAVAASVAAMGAGGSPPDTPPPGGATGLKSIDRRELQVLVDRRAEELGVPGAMVLLRTPQGSFTAASGTTELGASTPPRADTH